MADAGEDIFMKHFKALKRKCPPADLTSVLDLDNPGSFTNKISRITPKGVSADSMFGLLPVSEWRAYELLDVPGAIIIRNPFTETLRRYFVCRCLSDYPRQPNISNLDTSPRIFPEIWQAGCHPNSDLRARKYLHKLRWVTLGYHYDWTKKVYSQESCNDFPQDLSTTTQHIVQAVLGESCDFKAEAAIVNFYHLDSSLSGHTDHSEFDLAAPLISVSFGLPCVFMIGGQTKTKVPQALYLRDGDVVIMSGKARMSYHAVPKVLPKNVFSAAKKSDTPSSVDKNTMTSTVNPKCDDECSKRSHCEEFTEHSSAKKVKHDADTSCFTQLIDCVHDTEFWKPYETYLHESRINLNVRQLFEPGKQAKDYCWPTTDPAFNF